MLLKDYIENKELAIASEIYNANFGSVEDVVALMDKIKKESIEFDYIHRRYYATLHNIKVCLSHIAKENKDLKCIHEFATSHIAKLIKQFIESKDQEIFAEIEREIAENNTFDIVIVHEHKPGKGERMYGVPSCAFFNVVSCEKYYTFDNYDVEDDIVQVNKNIDDWKKEIEYWVNKKERMYDEYGLENLMPSFNCFIEHNGGFAADEKWVDYRIDYYYESDDCDDYEY